MRYPKRFFVLVVLFVAPGAIADDLWTLHGRVLSAQNQPVADVDIATFWSANGISRQVLNSKQQAGDESRFTSNEGRMEPLGSLVSSGEDGRFSVQLDQRNYFLLAMDKARTQGAFLIFNPNREPTLVEAKLAPLTRLHGKLRMAATGQAPKSSIVTVRVPKNEVFPFPDRVAMCASKEFRFEFRLPPGDYVLEAGTEVSTPESPISYEAITSITVPAGGRDLDVGILELRPAPPTLAEKITNAKAQGTWGDVDATKLIGQPAPNWHAVDARGISKTATVSDFKGKWVLVYFWSTSCAPCVGKSLPELAEFYNSHKANRNRFEIVAICIEPEGELRTLADLDRELKPVVASVWNGNALPFPVVLDNSFETMKRFGVVGFPKKFLIGPDGRIVQGDEKELAEKLEFSR